MNRIASGGASLRGEPRSSRRARGASLIEVLVAVVVLSLGLLGLAGLQMTSLRSNHSAYLRSQATLLAYDLTDRMRADCSGMGAGRYADGSDDRDDWDDLVTEHMGPDAQGSVALDGRAATITIQWNDNRGRIKTGDDTSTSSPLSFVYRTEPCSN